MKLTNLWDMFKKTYNGVHTSTIEVPPDTLSPAPFLAIKTLEHTEENPNDPEPEDEEYIQMDTTLISCTVQTQEQ
jgi:hypothetical protein